MSDHDPAGEAIIEQTVEDICDSAERCDGADFAEEVREHIDAMFEQLADLDDEDDDDEDDDDEDDDEPADLPNFLATAAGAAAGTLLASIGGRGRYLQRHEVTHRIDNRPLPAQGPESKTPPLENDHPTIDIKGFPADD